MPAALTVFLPGLLGPLPEDSYAGEALPGAAALAGLLNVAARRAAKPRDPAWRLTANFGIVTESTDLSAPPPIAAYSYLADFGVPPEQPCFRCDPVHLQADMSQALLYDSRSFDISAREAEGLAEAFNRQFAEDGLRLVFREPRRWFLLADNPPPLHTPVPDEVVGRNAGAFLPKEAGARYWNRVMNETQMLFFGHEVNLEREARGEPAVNGVWVYGGGRPSGGGTAAYDTVYSDDAFCKGLALHAGIAVRPWAEVLETGFWQTGGNILLFNGVLRDALLTGDVGRWSSLLEEWETRLFEPLRQQWRTGGFARLTIDPDDGHEYGVTAGNPGNRLRGALRSALHRLRGKPAGLAAFIDKNQTEKNRRP